MINRFLPQTGGTLGLDAVMEVLEKGIDWERGSIRWKLVYTSYSNLRFALIAPSPFIDTVTSQSIVTVPSGEGDCLRVGWKVLLWDDLNKVYFGDPINTITEISGDTITFENAWTTTLVAGTSMKFRFAGYNETIGNQKAKYGSVGPTGTTFDDGTQNYQIIA